MNTPTRNPWTPRDTLTVLALIAVVLAAVWAGC